MANILVIDDEPDICKLIERALQKDGHNVSVRNHVLHLEASDVNRYDLLLLDVMMPEVDGFTFCRNIRQDVDCPILFLTAKTMEQDLIDGFAFGADDYIKKPFTLSELRARVSAHLRREIREHHQMLTQEEYRFDLSAKELHINGERIPLTKSEYSICEFLARNKGTVFTLERMLELVFGFDTESDIPAIRVHVKNIRAKLQKYSKNPIETVWGVGYKWK